MNIKPRRYAVNPYAVKASQVVNQNPQGHKWMKPSGQDKSYNFVPVNKRLAKPLSASRLAVVLHEIRDHYGKYDSKLAALADQALTGSGGGVGQKGDVYTQIRDRLAIHSQGKAGPLWLGERGPNTTWAQRARDLATNYNWHRVGAGLMVDSEIGDYINKIAKDHLKATNEQFRAAHNVFGLGSDRRGKSSPESHRAFLSGLRAHLKSKLVGPDSYGGLDPAQVTDEGILKSIRRLAQNEEHTYGVLGTGGLRQAGHTSPVSEVPPAQPAWYPRKKGQPESGVGHVNPRARAGQFKRLAGARKYALPGEAMGIRHRSQPQGRPDDSGLLNTYAEHAGVQHALIAMGVIPPKTPAEQRPDYDRNVRRLVNLFVAHARRHINENPDDEVSKLYLDGAKRLHAPVDDELEYHKGPGRQVKRVNLDPMGMSITGLSTAAYPLLKKVATKLGLKHRQPQFRNQPQPSTLPPDPADERDLLEAANGGDYESAAAKFLHELGEHQSRVLGQHGLGKPQFGSHPSMYDVVDMGHDVGDFSLSQEVQLPGQSPDVAEIERTRTPKPRTKFNYPSIRQSIADHLASGGNYESTVGMLRDKHGLDRAQATAQLNNYNKLKAKPSPAEVTPKPTGLLKPPGSRMRSTKRVFARTKPVRYSIHIPYDKSLHSLIHASLGGENTPLAAAGDLLQEYGHPIGKHLTQIANGKGMPVNPDDSGVIGFYGSTKKGDGEVSIPYHYFSLPPDKTDVDKGHKDIGNGVAEYLHTPTGHFLNFKLYTDEDQEHGIEEGRRGHLLRVHPKHIQEIIDHFRKFYHKQTADEWEYALTHEPTVEPHLVRGVITRAQRYGLLPREQGQPGTPAQSQTTDPHGEPEQYAAYRAPAGGMVVRGTAYKGGAMVPNMEGSFMNPPKGRMSRVAAARQKLRK